MIITKDITPTKLNVNTEPIAAPTIPFLLTQYIEFNALTNTVQNETANAVLDFSNIPRRFAEGVRMLELTIYDKTRIRNIGIVLAYTVPNYILIITGAVI